MHSPAFSVLVVVTSYPMGRLLPLVPAYPSDPSVRVRASFQIAWASWASPRQVVTRLPLQQIGMMLATLITV